MKKGNFLIKPGTLFLVVVMALILFGLFNWASDAIPGSGEQSLEDQENAIVCSNLEVDFVDRGSNETHQFVYIQVNQPVEHLSIEFQESKNNTYTEELGEVEENSINRVSAPLKSVSEVSATARSCDRVFN